MKPKIQNIEELRAEITRLKSIKLEHETYLGEQFDRLEYKLETPMRLYEKVLSFFPAAKETFLSGNKSMAGTDWVSNSLRIGLPFLFNKVLFKNAGFIKKGLLLLASQQAASLFNKERLAGIIDLITSVIKPKAEKESKSEMDFGIPPDSETS